MATHTEESRSLQFNVPLLEECNVCVIGGGSAGIGAATAAAKAGASTVLVERYGFLGGTSTAGLVGPMMTSWSSDGKEPITGGVYREVVDRMIGIGGAIDPAYCPPASSYGAFITLGHSNVTPFHPEALKIAAQDTVLEAGARIRFHTNFVRVEVQDGVIQEAVLLDKRGMGRIRAGVFVDCSADADVAADAGVPYSKGRSSDGKMMPATMFMRLGNVDDAKVEAHARAHPDERLFKSIVSKAREEGVWDLQRDFLSIYREPEPGEYRANISRLLNIDGTNPDDLTQAEIDGRRQCLFIFQFMRNNCPGLENARLLQIASHIGIRETRHIEGLYTLTAEDVLSGRRFKDAIGRGSYPIDIHDPSGSGMVYVGMGEKSDEAKSMLFHSEVYKDPRKDAPPFYDIPFRCLVPVSMHNLLVAGRPISATHEAAASLRVIPPCYATGQAAGTAAALSVRENQQLEHIDTTALRKILKKQGAIV